MAAYHELTHDQLLALPTDRLYKVFKIYRSYDLQKTAAPDEDSMSAFIKRELDTRGHIPRKHNPNADNVDTPFAKQKTYWSRYFSEPKREPPHGSIENYEDAIGKQVFKKSKKPFKSKNLYNTVKAVTKNLHTGLPAFSFEEDESIVDANICNIREVKG